MNLIKQIIAVLLLTSIILLSSCDYYGNYFIKNGRHPKDTYFPEGYTGGFGISHGDTDAAYYWVETYEECIAAIELLKSHGSGFYPKAIFSYEGELFDTKYCFSIGRKYSDKIEYGENPFDRWAKEVHISAYCFYNEVTIDELIYSYVSNYNGLYFQSRNIYKAYSENPDVLNEEDIYYQVKENRYCAYIEDYGLLYEINGYNNNQPSKEEADAISNSIVIIDEKGDIHRSK